MAKAGQQVGPVTYYKVQADVLQKVLEYLNKRPLGEVYGMFEALRVSRGPFQDQPPPEKPGTKSPPPAVAQPSELPNRRRATRKAKKLRAAKN